jgi:hypothetical protein
VFIATHFGTENVRPTLVPVRRDRRSSGDSGRELVTTAAPIVVAGNGAGRGTLDRVVARPRALDRADVADMSIP